MSSPVSYTILIVLSTSILQCGCTSVVPLLPLAQYVNEGDVNLGGLFPVSAKSQDMPCGTSLRSLSAVQVVEAMVFAIEAINRNATLLPNVSLGYAILDDCSKPTTSLAQATRFIPANETFSCKNDTELTQGEYKTHVDVVGVVGSLMSSLSKQSASLLGVFQIPQISYSSTSDELSDKGTYPYFFRVVSPDKFQVKGIVHLIKQFGWSYISVMYNDGTYGQMGVKLLRQLTAGEGICIAVDEEAPFPSMDAGYDKVVAKLVNNSNARVVVLFIGPPQAKAIFNAIKRANATGKFIFVGSDGWGARLSILKDLTEVAESAFTFQLREIPLPEFETYFQTLTPSVRRHNPWFNAYWETYFGCSLQGGSNQCNNSLKLSYTNGYSNTPLVAMVIDSVYTFAHALHRLITENCPGRRGAQVRSCIDGPRLHNYMKSTRFDGFLGKIAFDANGDMQGQYLVQQIRNVGGKFAQKYFSVWDARLNQFVNLQNQDLTWPHKVQLDDNGVPESVCSKPCTPGQFVIPQETICCWLCKLCRDNEIVTRDQRGCLACPKFYWPEQTNFTKCETIPPVYLQITDPLGILLFVLSLVGFAGSVAVFVFFVRHNNSKLIKACSRELAYIILVGVAIGYLLILVMIAVPSKTACHLRYFGYTVSFTLVYAPLLTRTIRISRIFESSRLNKSPKLVSPRAQVIIAAVLICIQLVISAVTALISPPLPALIMASPTVRYVELDCPFKLHGFVSFLSYNVILVVACSIYAFKTRKLPQNFNESRFISMCVYTTVVVWIAFIPTYFTTSTSYYRVLLLSLALIVNDTIFLIFLYLPKIYALLYVDEDDMILNSLINPATSVYPTQATFVGKTMLSLASVNSPAVANTSASFKQQEVASLKSIHHDMGSLPPVKG